METAERIGITCKEAKVHSSDAFYTLPEIGTWQDIKNDTQTECVEMESFALFHNAKVLGKKAASILTISDAFYNNVALSAEERQTSFTQMMTLALESALTF